MAKLERTYNIPLRRKFQRAPKYRRAKRAVIEVKNFLTKHMKAVEVKVGEHLNRHIWANGIKNPPHHVKVVAVKEDDGIVKVELFGKKYEVKKKEEKVEKTKLQETLEKAGLKKDKKEEKVEEEKPVEEKKEEPKPEVKKEEPKPVEPKTEPKVEKKEEPKVEKKEEAK